MKEGDLSQEYKYTAELFTTFFNRGDAYARQLDNGQYLCIHQPPLIELMNEHLNGEITLGSYILNEENQASFLVFDADDDISFASIQEIALLSGLKLYSERSRRGGHVWGFFERPVPGVKAKRFGKGILEKVIQNDNVGVEIFPKQGSSKGPGSLIRVPFGIHQKSGIRYPFIDHAGNPLGTWQQQMAILSSPERIRLDVVEKYQYSDEKPTYVVFNSDSKLLWERIKENTDVMSFLSSLIELRPTPTGGIGHCPFHDDEHASFGVNREGNYWHCFAGCGGGSVIDFWMTWNNCDFKTAVEELAEILAID